MAGLENDFLLESFNLPGCKFFSINDFFNSHQLSVALCKDDNFPCSTSSRSPCSIRQLISTTFGGGQKVAHGEGHAQVGVLVDRGIATLDWYVVVGLVTEEEVVSHGDSKDCATPCERTWK